MHWSWWIRQVIYTSISWRKATKLDGEFESLSFKTQDRKTELTCQDAEHDWRIALQGQDARELVTLIEEAKEEYETLMRDLC
ncbi:hypothetical protein ABDK09_16480 [Vibrio sp. CDRSL-10 TSBA]